MIIYDNLYNAILSRLRKPVLLSLMKMFANIMQAQYDKLYNIITHSGQVASLEHFLNDQFNIPYDISTRALDIAAGNIIYLTDGVILGTVYVYNNLEGQNVPYLYNNSEGVNGAYLYNNSEYSGEDFIIYVPNAMSPMISMIKANANMYLLADKKYKILIY